MSGLTLQPRSASRRKTTLASALLRCLIISLSPLTTLALADALAPATTTTTATSSSTANQLTVSNRDTLQFQPSSTKTTTTTTTTTPSSTANQLTVSNRDTLQFQPSSTKTTTTTATTTPSSTANQLTVSNRDTLQSQPSSTKTTTTTTTTPASSTDKQLTAVIRVTLQSQPSSTKTSTTKTTTTTSSSAAKQLTATIRDKRHWQRASSTQPSQKNPAVEATLSSLIWRLTTLYKRDERALTSTTPRPSKQHRSSTDGSIQSSLPLPTGKLSTLVKQDERALTSTPLPSEQRRSSTDGSTPSLSTLPDTRFATLYNSDELNSPTPSPSKQSRASTDGSTQGLATLPNEKLTNFVKRDERALTSTTPLPSETTPIQKYANKEEETISHPTTNPNTQSSEPGIFSPPVSQGATDAPTTPLPPGDNQTPSVLSGSPSASQEKDDTSENTTQRPPTSPWRTLPPPIFQVATRVPTTPSPSTTSEGSPDVCIPVEVFRRNATEGSIEWVFDYQSCMLETMWLLSIPTGYGIVMEFHHAEMKDSDSLEVFTLSKVKGYLASLRNFKQGYLISLSPLLIREDKVSIVLKTPQEGKYRKWRKSRFHLTYSAHPVDGLPMPVSSDDVVDTESDVIYACDGISNLPQAISCDGIQHCDGGEDEVSCSYRSQGCGTWFPFKDKCFKATFKKRRGRISGQSSSTMPLQAEKACQDDYGGTLATLQESGAMKMATEMVHRSGFSNAVVGIRKAKPLSRRLSHLYRFLWQWGQQGGPMAYEQQELQRSGVTLDCAMLDASGSLKSLPCVLPLTVPQGFICMRSNPTLDAQTPAPSALWLTMPTTLPSSFPVKGCPDGSLVQLFHRCQWGEEEETQNDEGWSPNNLPLFKCRYGQSVHYSLLCDGNDDCADRSDELDCRWPRFAPLMDSSFVCQSVQAIPAEQRCNGESDCLDESDEESCVSCGRQIMCPGVGCVTKEMAKYFATCPSLPPVQNAPLVPFNPGHVVLDGDGMSELDFVPNGCGEGYYSCQDRFCIPTFLLNNGEQDCPWGEDEEIPVTNVSCPGYYRCQGQGSCVHANYLCDGIYHCPNKDDEMFCHATCPRDRGCECEGQAYTCSSMVDPLHNLHVRYLDVSHARNVSLENIHFMEYLFFLNLSFCGLDNVTLADMPQLQTLDLSNNLLTQLDSLKLNNLRGLVFLDLSNNPFVKTLGSAFSTMLNDGRLHNLKTLLMTSVGLKAIDSKAFHPLSNLMRLDIRLNQIDSYAQDALSGLVALEELYTDESKLCCSYFHATLSRCHAPVDELSSCSDLLGQDFFRVFLWILSALALLGNAGVLTYRLFFSKQKSATSSQVLVKNLCASDLLMGIYMMIIGVADAHFHGVYVSKESEWKSSVACTVAGWMSFVSSEVSAFVVCLITLDRVLVICFPFNLRLHFSSRSAVFACCAVWFVGISLATVPLLAGLEFYGQNGICVPLPITRQQYSGQKYAFGVFIVLNFAVFILIGLGQVLIYRAIQSARKAAGSQRREQDLAVARRLFLIVLTDFCCWFPIGLMGLLAASGTPIPGEVNVWAAIFVLPLNSALNPFLYTLNGLMEKWKNERLEKRTKKMLGKLQTEIPKWSPSNVVELVRICVQSRLVEKQALGKVLGVHGDLPSTAFSAGTRETESMTCPEEGSERVNESHEMTSNTNLDISEGSGGKL